MKQRARKLMTICKALLPGDDVGRLKTSRTGGRGVASMEDSVDASIQRLEDYIEKHGRRLIIATRNNTDNTRNDNNKKKWK